jgi:hypothetical protein
MRIIGTAQNKEEPRMVRLLSALVFAVVLLFGLGSVPSASYAASNEGGKGAKPIVVAMEHGDEEDADDSDDNDGEDDDSEDDDGGDE